MQSSITLNPSQAFKAFDDWASLQQIRGKTAEQTLKKVMKFWISFALFRVDAATPADIERNLMKLTTAYSSRLAAQTGAYSNLKSRRSHRAKGSAQADKYRGTVAAAIVAILNYRNAKSQGRAGFYQTVGKFVSARKYSARHHKAGFYPAISALKISQKDGRLPKYKNTPGSYSENILETAATLVAENFASSAQRPGRPAPLGIAGLAPDCLSAAEADVAKLIAAWLMKDLMVAAHGAGFAALSSGPVTTPAL